MKLERKLSVLEAQIAEANSGEPANLNGWRVKTETTIRAVMGAEHPLLRRFTDLRYTPNFYGGQTTDGAAYRRRGVRQGVDILEAAIAELELTADVEEEITTTEADPALEGAAEHGRIFIVHGHDGNAKHELARVLHALSGADPVILHDEPNRGMVLIEKFEKAAAATGYAVALLTADDVGGVSGPSAPLKKRARQNVVFETGFFIGAFGRGRVAVLVEEGVERPSDLQGLVYIELDRNGGWKPQLARELRAAGMPVNFEVLGSV